MLKGHVFNMQTFTSEAFALFIDKFLNGKSGVARGCELSNTNNSITVGEGYFVVKGRFLQIITVNGFYSLICEIDLGKANTTDELNQAKIKVISSTNNYPELQKQDITTNGTIYQYEFARFKVENGNITNVEDKRTFIDFDTIYNYIQKESDEMFKKIAKELEHVLDGSAYCLKKDMLKMEVKQLKDKLDNEDRLKATISTIAELTVRDIRNNGEETNLTYNGYYREILSLLYIDKVKKIIAMLDEKDSNKVKLINWLNNVKVMNANLDNASAEFQETWLGIPQRIIALVREESYSSFFIPKSMAYPDLSLSTIITNLYNSLE